MELRHLRYFVAVAEALSFTKAAQRLRLAQPSLTRQVRNLEEEIGVRLLDRSKNQIAMTEEGRMFFLDAKKILAACAETIAAVQEIGRSGRRQLNIGYTADTHFKVLPATLAAFRKLYPEVALNLFDMTRAEQLDALESRRIDLGFVGVSPLPPGHNLSSKCIAHDTIFAALAQNDPLSNKAELKLPDLSTQFFICMSAKTGPGDCEWVVQTCRSAGFAARILQEALDGLSAVRFVRDGLGVALVPEQITELPHEGVVFRSLLPPLRREATIAWRMGDTSEALTAYIKITSELSRSL